MKINKLTEDLCKNKRALGLVSMLTPVELMKSLIKNLDLVPKEAAKVVYDLKKKAEGLSPSSIETNKEFPVPPSLKSEDEIEELWGPGDIKGRHFPPEPRSEPNDFPYDSTFVNYMNNPKRKKPLMNSKNKLDQDVDINQPGGDGAGGHLNVKFLGGSGEQPGGGSSWDAKGKDGWSHHLSDKEFEIPPQSIRKKDKAPIEKKIPNAGDNDDFPQIFKNANVGQNIPLIGYGGATPIRLSKTGYRNYGRK